MNHANIHTTTPLFEQYRKKLHRIAWKIQYKARAQYKREIVTEDQPAQTISFTDSTDSHLFLEQLVTSLPPDLSRKVIHDIFIQGKTESELAHELHISQQAVNKWKRKALKQLRQTLIS